MSGGFCRGGSISYFKFMDSGGLLFLVLEVAWKFAQQVYLRLDLEMAVDWVIRSFLRRVLGSMG